MIPFCHMLDYEVMGMSVDWGRVDRKVSALDCLTYPLLQRCLDRLNEGVPLFSFSPGGSMLSKMLVNKQQTWRRIKQRPEPPTAEMFTTMRFVR